MRISKNGRVIASLLDWEKYAGPKSSGQWVDERSAKEVARAWLASGEEFPSEVSAALLAHPRFGVVLDWRAEPEAKLRFDGFPGEPRNSDLAIYARDATGRYLLAIEAKADEPYGETVAMTIDAAGIRLKANPRSNGLNRVRQLAEALFGDGTAAVANVASLRYQLLTASAGALCAAEQEGYDRTVLLVQEFVTNKTSDDNHLRNSHDLLAFINALKPGVTTVVMAGILYGPFTVPGGNLLKRPPELYIGKVTRNLRTTEA